MIEIKALDPDYEYSDELQPEVDDTMPDVQPNMLCLMDCDYSSRSVITGKATTLRRGTPIIIKTVDKPTKTVTAIDAQRNVWTFQEYDYNNFGDIDGYFEPVTKPTYQWLTNPKAIKKTIRREKLSEMSGAKALTILSLFTFGCMSAMLKDVVSPTVGYTLFGLSALSGLALITLCIISMFASQYLTPTALLKFAEHQEGNTKELQSLMTECPIFAEEDEY